MTSAEFVTSFEQPSVNSFIQLRKKIGWGDLKYEFAQASIENSLYHVSITHHSTLVAMGRVVGDGVMYFYIQDVIVAPEFQGNGLGTIIMEHIESYLAGSAVKGSTIGLLAAKGKEGFYKKFSYTERSGDPLGLALCKFI